MSNILELVNVSKSYMQGSNQLDIIRNINLSLRAGELVGLVGPSGSGKSSLLHIAGLLDEPTSGDVWLMGDNYSKASEVKRTKARNKHLGFIYQFHHLLADFTALENVMMPQMIAGISKKVAKIKACQLLESVGLASRINHLPGELSGGEQQRVAIVRALANDPKLLLADEPTGNLDQNSCDVIFDLLVNQVKSKNIASLIVTHNMEIAQKIDSCYVIKDGDLQKL
ncbi:Lipoprotein-releasing system ATP-binding protein LolD [Candidatus Arcanobacter lacustris]|uniref:Lipoprotein-releasing system ATP-binding protein LolD n=1 Tax=Candidatus Arcanibacter lacustris TaxID=1607817 RepID=A0A0F5MS11_9RICK|nr:Lipoprotein-releasing system ATP-binding protein LolD [Candidatus Arcanobacter lacustris]